MPPAVNAAGVSEPAAMPEASLATAQAHMLPCVPVLDGLPAVISRAKGCPASSKKCVAKCPSGCVTTVREVAYASYPLVIEPSLSPAA